MLKSHINQYFSNSISLPPLSTPLISKQYSSTSFSTTVFQPVLVKKRRSRSIRNTMASTTKTMVSTSSVGKFTTMKGVISVQPTISGVLTSVTVGLLGTVADRFSDLLGKSFLVELVSADLDSSVKEKETVKAYARPYNDGSKLSKYQCEFKVPYDFGDIGAILVENQLRKEAYIKDIVIDDGSVIFSCESWIHSKYDNPDKRIFFTNKALSYTGVNWWWFSGGGGSDGGGALVSLAPLFKSFRPGSYFV